MSIGRRFGFERRSSPAGKTFLVDVGFNVADCGLVGFDAVVAVDPDQQVWRIAVQQFAESGTGHQGWQLLGFGFWPAGWSVGSGFVEQSIQQRRGAAGKVPARRR